MSQETDEELRTEADRLLASGLHTILNDYGDASIGKLGLNKSDESKFMLLRQNRGQLLKRSTSGPPQVVADGRGDWIGWVELRTEAVNEVATQMTAKVIHDVNADVLAVIEAEDRIALKYFNDQLLKPVNATYNGESDRPSGSARSMICGDRRESR